MEQQGELFGEDIVGCTGLILPMADSKDNRVVYQRCSVVLMHPSVFEHKNNCKRAIANKAKKQNVKKKQGWPKKRGRLFGSKNKPKIVANTTASVRSSSRSESKVKVFLLYMRYITMHTKYIL